MTGERSLVAYSGRLTFLSERVVPLSLCEQAQVKVRVEICPAGGSIFFGRSRVHLLCEVTLLGLPRKQ